VRTLHSTEWTLDFQFLQQVALSKGLSFSQAESKIQNTNRSRILNQNRKKSCEMKSGVHVPRSRTGITELKSRHNLKADVGIPLKKSPGASIMTNA
jgi:hypothetical protein